MPMRKPVPAAATSPLTRACSVSASIAWTIWSPGRNGRIAGTTHSADGAPCRRASSRPIAPTNTVAMSMAIVASTAGSAPRAWNSVHATAPRIAACAVSRTGTPSLIANAATASRAAAVDATGPHVA